MLPSLLRSTLFVLVVLAARAVSGTILVPMRDRDLVRTSPLIVVGQVQGIESTERRNGRVVTEITLAVEQTIKGRLATSTIVVTEPGGRVGDKTAWIFGAPDFTVGERVLVFLKHDRDGRLRTNALALGKYGIDARPGRTAVARRLQPTRSVRRLDHFLSRLSRLTARDGDAGEAMPSGRVPEEADPVMQRTVSERFTFLGNPPSRWFEPTVTFHLANAENTLGVAASQTVINNALAAWTNVATASITLTLGTASTQAPSIAGGVCDGKNTFMFNDPYSEVDDMVSCSGVLAVGGFCNSGETISVNGTTFQRIVEGDLTVNNGVGACFGTTSTAEVLTHEIGHAIGMGHSSEDPNEPNATLKDATMYFLAHFDGRGASVHSDDIAGVSAIYPGSAPQPDGDGDGVPDSADQCPNTPASTPVDATGCACVDPGHVSCDDGSVCTTDSCNVVTAQCVHTQISCADADPCTYDSCNPQLGCQHVQTGDMDNDGICDLLDDSDGDGVVDYFDQCQTTHPGQAVDSTGCACADPGHVSCDDHSVCTTDSCNAATGLCVHTPIDCSDSDPCTTDSCDPIAGCQHGPTADKDGDGVCDLLDNCPSLATSDNTDADGDGVGDACECTERNPGHCVPGTGRKSSRCFVEWRPLATAPVRRGLPTSHLRCHDGDAGCDVDGVTGQCTFELLLCINNRDPRFPSCIPWTTSQVRVVSPRPGGAKDRASTENLQAIASALDLSSQTMNDCSGPVRLVVPLRGRRASTRAFKVKTSTKTGPGTAQLKLTCEP